MKLLGSDGGGKPAALHFQPRAHTQLRPPCRQALSTPPVSRAVHKPQPQSSVVAAAAATRGQGASAASHGHHASELSPEAAKEGMHWLAAWVSSQYMGMGKSAEDAMPELRRRGVVCSSANNGQVLFKVPDQAAPLDGPQLIKLLRLKARPGVKLTDPPPPPGLAPSRPAPKAPQSSSPPRDESPRSTSPSREYQVGRLPDSPDSLAMRWLSEWIAARYTGFGKRAEDVLPELRRRGVVYSSIKDGRLMFRVPGVVSRVDPSQVIYMMRLQPRPGVRPEEPEPPQSLMSALAGSRMEDASPLRQASPSSSRNSSPNRYSSPSRTRASTTLSPEAAALGMRWLAIFVSSQYSGMGRSAEDALPELKAQGVVCTSVRDGRPMFVVPGHEGEVDAQEVVKILRLEVRPGARGRAPTPPPALAGARSAPAGAPAAQPAEAPPQATAEDGFKWLATWVATNYMGMGKTVEDALPELRRRGVVCSSIKSTTPMFRMPGQKAEIDGAQVIKSLRLQPRPGVDATKPSPPRGLVLGTSGGKPQAAKPSPSASAAVATAAASAAARRASSASSKASSSSKAPPAPASSTATKAAASSATKAEPKTEPQAETKATPQPPRPVDPDNNIIVFLGQLFLPAVATVLAAAAIGGGSILWEKIEANIPSRDELAKQKTNKPGFNVRPPQLGPTPPGLTEQVAQPGSFKIGGAAPSVTVKPREEPRPPAPEPQPPPPPLPPPPPKIGVQNQGGGVSPLDAQRESELRIIQEQEQRRVQQEELERQQRFREEQERERVAKEQEARAQQQKEQQQAREQQAREQQLREERAKQERERREAEQREKEQKEKEQREREQEKEQREQQQREQEQRAQEQKAREAAAPAPPVQGPRLGESRPSGVQPLPGAQQQGGVQPLQPQPQGGVLPKQALPEPYIDPNKPRGVQPLRPEQQQREGVQPAPQGPYEPPNQPRGLLPDAEEPQPPKLEKPQSIGGGLQRRDGGEGPLPRPGSTLPSIGGAMPNMSGSGPQAQAKQAEQPREQLFQNPWGTREKKVEPVEEGFAESEEDLAKDLSTLATPGSKGILQQGGGQIEGYEACIYRSIGC